MTSSHTPKAQVDYIYRADLRAFGAIGFQDVWLKRQGLESGDISQAILMRTFLRGIDVIGLTSEDDKMISGSPEDRFGFVKKGLESLSDSFDEPERGVLRIRKGGKSIYIINCQTMHDPNWQGLKLHVIGGNCLPQRDRLNDAVNYANDKGYMTFLMNVDESNGDNLNLVESVVFNCTGVIGHDANNVFPDWMRSIPVFGKRFKGKARSRNLPEESWIETLGKPSIAVSSAHWIQEIGSAGIQYASVPEEHFSLRALELKIEGKRFRADRGYNSPLRVLQTGYLLNKYGTDQGRFKGDKSSSYNQ
ncbi:MAG: hypothetical protein AABW89_06175 [Nanoarchaeota archaeon]